MNRSESHLEILISRHFGGELDTLEQQELASLLAESAEARVLFASYMRIEGATIQLGKAGCLSQNLETAPPAETTVPTPAPAAYGPVSRPQWGIAQMAMATLVACVVVGAAVYAVQSWRDTGSFSFPADEVPSVAELVRTVNAQWQNTGMPTSVGSALPPGTLSLGSGLVEIAFRSGATVIVEGPADLDLIAADQAYLHRGRLRELVPADTSGLTIASADMTVADPGVEFGLQVDDAGNAELHVFDGEAKLDKAGLVAVSDGARILRAGNAIRIDASGQPSVMSADDSSFVGRRMLAVVAETNIQELKHQLKRLKQREAVLTTDVKDNINRVTQSPQLVEIDRAWRQARSQLSDFLDEHQEIVAAEKAVAAAQAELEEQLEARMAASKASRAAHKDVLRLRAELKKLKQKQKAARTSNDKAAIKSLERTRQQAVASRNRAEKTIQQLRHQVKQQDPELRELSRRHNAARKALQKLTGMAQYLKLREAVDDVKKSRETTRNKLLREDEVYDRCARN